MYDLSVIIPAKNEEYLGRTIDDILAHIGGKTEIIAILDGYLPNPPLNITDPRITIIYNPVSVGQRAASNQAARISTAKYLMKIDAHVSMDQDFDVKMLADMQDDWTLIPLMKNLHVFDWVCENGHRRYQSPSGICESCKMPTHKEVVWRVKNNPTSQTYRFDRTMHFQYWNDYGRKQPGDLVESMSIQGSCFMCTRKKWFELDICSEDFYSWGQQGVEVACKTWLSGGRVMCTKKTWYAHLFRTRGGDFGFPYKNPQSEIDKNRELSRELFQRDKWPGAKYKFQWLLDKFNPPDWGNDRGAIYYTDSQLDEKIAAPVRSQLEKCAKEKNFGIVSASLKKMKFGVKNICFPSMKKGYLAMHKQILGALENSTADVLFFTEHDVLYHPSHFDFVPLDKNTFYYNQNVWLLRNTDGHALHYDVNQLSGLCVYREAALTHFRERYEIIKAEYDKGLPESDFVKFVRNIGFEPFTHGRIQWKNQFKYEPWKSPFPNVDIKHGKNATGQRWTKEEYRNQQLLINWTESENWTIPGWEKGRLIVFRQEN